MWRHSDHVIAQKTRFSIFFPSLISPFHFILFSLSLHHPIATINPYLSRIERSGTFPEKHRRKSGLKLEGRPFAMPFTGYLAGTKGSVHAKFQHDPCTYTDARMLLRYEKVSPNQPFCFCSLWNAPNVGLLSSIGFRIDRWALLSQEWMCGSYGKIREKRKILKISAYQGAYVDSYCSEISENFQLCRGSCGEHGV